jgi:hypothetical protein
MMTNRLMLLAAAVTMALASSRYGIAQASPVGSGNISLRDGPGRTAETRRRLVGNISPSGLRASDKRAAWFLELRNGSCPRSECGHLHLHLR